MGFEANFSMYAGGVTGYAVPSKNTQLTNQSNSVIVFNLQLGLLNLAVSTRVQEADIRVWLDGI
jgi:hypothetical protein